MIPIRTGMGAVERRNLGIVLSGSVIILLSPLVGGQDVSGPCSRQPDVIFQGKALRACEIAFDDFCQSVIPGRLSRNEQGEAEQLRKYLSIGSNHTIEIETRGGDFVVSIYPKPSARFPVIFGGDAVYLIDGEDLVIRSVELGK